MTLTERLHRDAAVLGTIDALRAEAKSPHLGWRLEDMIVGAHVRDTMLATTLDEIDREIEERAGAVRSK